MPRVRSDDFSGDGDEINREPPKTPSPIGAGLPLLQRLRLLKEKQVRYYFFSLIFMKQKKITFL
jgi:hypothetical protein